MTRAYRHPDQHRAIHLRRKAGSPADAGGACWAIEAWGAKPGSSNDYGLSGGTEGDHDRARELVNEALDLSRDLGDKSLTLDCMHSLVAYDTSARVGERAIRSYKELLTMAREIGSRTSISRELWWLGYWYRLACDFDKARSAYEEGLRLVRELRVPALEANFLDQLACLAHTQGRLNDCRAMSEEVLAISRELGSRNLMARSLHHIGLVSENQGDDPAAEKFYEQALAIHRETGFLLHIAWILADLAVHGARRHDVDRANAHIEEGLGILEAFANRAVDGIRWVTSLHSYALARLGHHARACRLMADGRVLNRDSSAESVMLALEVYAVLAMGVDAPECAARLFGVAAALRERFGIVQLPVYRDDYGADQSALRRELGEEMFARAIAEGRAMELEKAIEYAIGESTSERT